jgi:hypothetical protein
MIICNVPNKESLASIAMTVAFNGGLSAFVSDELFTPAEID